MKVKKKNRIKMRVNKSPNPKCKVCGNGREKSIELFDLAFDEKHIITICDACNEDLFTKSLKATCHVNGKIKSKHDMLVKRLRNKN